MANKRLKKKREKQAQTQLLVGAGYTPKEMKKLPANVRVQEVKRIERNQRERTRRQENRQKLLDAGVPLSIIKRDRLDYKSFGNYDRKKLNELRNRGRKLDELTRNGIKNFSQSDLKLSWPKLIAKYGDGITPPEDYYTRGTTGNKKAPPVNTTLQLTGQWYLYVGVAEIEHVFSIPDYTGWDDDRLIAAINERIREARNNPSGSDTAFCLYRTYVGTRSECEDEAAFYYERGYNLSKDRFKANMERFQRLTVSNSFYQREFHEMIYTCISQMLNENVADFMISMRDFCNRNGFPFTRNLHKISEPKANRLKKKRNKKRPKKAPKPKNVTQAKEKHSK